MLEVERQDRKVLLLGQCHHGRVDEPDTKVGEPGVDVYRAAKKPRRCKGNRVLAARHRLEERSRRRRRHSRPQKLINLDQDEI